jgi:hypothetical protein
LITINENLCIVVDGVRKPLPNPIKVTIIDTTMDQYKRFGYSTVDPNLLPNPIRVTISNPPLEVYREFNYNPKALVIKEEPEYDIGSQYLVPCVEDETDTEIIQGWEIKENEFTDDEIIEE